MRDEGDGDGAVDAVRTAQRLRASPVGHLLPVHGADVWADAR